jgi:transcriptional regulator with XRE-family HTH domain
MTSAKFKEIREQLGLTQEELAKLLGLAGKKSISHLETDFRTPSPLIAAFMSYLGSLSERKAQEFVDEFQRHMAKVQKAGRNKKNG